MIDLLSRDCDGCSNMKLCGKRYYKVEKGEKVYCPDGTAHLVDYASIDESVTVPLIDNCFSLLKTVLIQQLN